MRGAGVKIAEALRDMLTKNTVLTSLTYVSELIFTGRYQPTARSDRVIVLLTVLSFPLTRLTSTIDGFPIFLEGLELNSTLETLE